MGDYRYVWAGSVAMRAKFTLIRRVAGRFLTVPFREGVPVAPESGGSYYARFTEDGKRHCKPLGNELGGALAAIRKLELMREYNVRGLPAPLGSTAAVTHNYALDAYKSWTDARIGKLQSNVTQLTERLQMVHSTVRSLEAKLASCSEFRDRSHEVKRETRTLEKRYSLTAAAKVIGIKRQTLKLWLRHDLGILIPPVRRGTKVLVSERDIERLIAKRRTAQGAVRRP